MNIFITRCTATYFTTIVSRSESQHKMASGLQYYTGKCDEKGKSNPSDYELSNCRYRSLVEELRVVHCSYQLCRRSRR